MADDQPDRFQGQGEGQGPSVAESISSALAALAGGLALGAHDVTALADELGDLNIPVESECIAEFDYNIQTGDLGVTFTDGSVYPYHRVTMFNFLAWLNAGSKGGFYNRFVRGIWT